MDRRWMSHAILEDLQSMQRSQEWGSQDARLKPSVSTLDLPRTPYHERRSSLYRSTKFLAVPGMTGRTYDTVREISYGSYIREREQYRTSAADEAKQTALGIQRRAEQLQGHELEMRRLGLLEAGAAQELAREAAPSPWRACRHCASPRVSGALSEEALSLALAPRSKEEEALYVECQIAEDELRRDIVTAPMIMACLVACISQFLSGYNTSVMNAPERFVFPGHSTVAWSFAVSSFAIGGPVGAVLGGYLANATGRRQALLFDACVFLFGGCLMTLAPTMIWLIVGRFVVGLASGFASVLVPVYLGELAPPVLRGTFGTCTQFAMVLGILASDVLAFELAESWRVLFGVTPLLAGLQLLCAPQLVETPRWLLDRDENSQEARLVLQKLYGFRDPEQLEHEVSHVVGANAVHKLAESQASALNDAPVSALGSLYRDRAVRPLLFASVALHVAQQLCGINSVFYYSTMFFDGVIDNPLLGTTLVAAINVAATYAAIVLMDQCGRKSLLAWSSGGMLACVVLITMVLYGLLPKLFALLAVMAYVSFFEIGLGPIPWLSQTELFDSHHVDTAQSIACQLGPAVFAPFGLVLLLTFLFAVFLFPETRGASIEEIQHAMKQNIANLTSGVDAKPLVGPVVQNPLVDPTGRAKYAPLNNLAEASSEDADTSHDTNERQPE